MCRFFTFAGCVVSIRWGDWIAEGGNSRPTSWHARKMLFRFRHGTASRFLFALILFSLAKFRIVTFIYSLPLLNMAASRSIDWSSTGFIDWLIDWLIDWWVKSFIFYFLHLIFVSPQINGRERGCLLCSIELRCKDPADALVPLDYSRGKPTKFDEVVSGAVSEKNTPPTSFPPQPSDKPRVPRYRTKDFWPVKFWFFWLALFQRITFSVRSTYIYPVLNWYVKKTRKRSEQFGELFW